MFLSKMADQELLIQQLLSPPLFDLKLSTYCVLYTVP